MRRRRPWLRPIVGMNPDTRERLARYGVPLLLTLASILILTVQLLPPLFGLWTAFVR